MIIMMVAVTEVVKMLMVMRNMMWLMTVIK